MALEQARARDFDSEAMTLLKATRIIRRDIMNMKKKLKNNWQQQSVPHSLKTMVGMILEGPDIKTQSSDMFEVQTTLSISELVFFNASIRCWVSGTTNTYHSRDREPPLPIYLGLMTHAETRNATFVDKLPGIVNII